MTTSRFNFLFGVTPAAVSNAITVFGNYSKEIAHAHNSILQIGVSCGAMVMTLYVVFLLNIALKCFQCISNKNNQKVYSVLIGIVICILLINMMEAFLFEYFSISSCIFYLCAGFLFENNIEIYSNRIVKNRKIMIRNVLSFSSFLLCILCLLVYCDKYIKLNNNRITGAGTRENPYLIDSETDLYYFRDLVNHGNTFKDCYFLQKNDLDLKMKKWEPIGLWYADFSFDGVYDGDLHVIENLFVPYDISDGTYGRNGLFGYINGTIKNLGIESGLVEGDYVGGIVSRSDKGTVLNCYNRAEINGTSRAGGICDAFIDGVVINCINDGILKAPVTANLVSWDAGTVVASDDENNFSSYFTGKIIPISITGDTIHQKLNSGLETLISLNILRRNDAKFWE